jgi:hypothetical protein
LTWAFANSTLQTQTLFGVSTPSANQQAHPSPDSFSDALADAQASPNQSQDETVGSTSLIQPFQTAPSSWRTASSGSQASSRDSTSGSSENSAPTTTAAPKPASAAPKQAEDTYVANGAKHQSPPATHPAVSAGESIDPKPADKAKQRKNASHTSVDTSEGDSQAGNPAVDDARNSTRTINAASTANSPEQAPQSAQNAPDTESNGHKSKANDFTGNLAFAVKVQGDSSPSIPSMPATNPAANVPDSSGQDPSSEFAAQMSALISSIGQKTASSSKAPKDETGPSALILPPSGSQSGTGTAAETEIAGPEEVAKVMEVPDDPTAGAQPLKTVQVQIIGVDNQRVDLRLMEKAGTLTMSVRSEDGSLTKALQQHLPELATSLNDQQIHAEWWKPDFLKTESSQAPDSSSNSGNSNNSTAQDQKNQGRGNSEQQGGRGTPQTDWLEELSNLRKSSQNGAQYSWHL